MTIRQLNRLFREAANPKQPLGWRPPTPKRGRPRQQRDRNMQIAAAVAMLIEEPGLKPNRSHFERQRHTPSACSIVTAALERMNWNLTERTVEGIWDRYRRSPSLIHPNARNYVRFRYHFSSLIIR
jgi:hypothetical protein